MSENFEPLQWTDDDVTRANIDFALTELTTLIFEEGMPDSLHPTTAARVFDYCRIAFQHGQNAGVELGFKHGYAYRQQEQEAEFIRWAQEREVEQNAEEPPQPQVGLLRRLLRWLV